MGLAFAAFGLVHDCVLLWRVVSQGESKPELLSRLQKRLRVDDPTFLKLRFCLYGVLENGQWTRRINTTDGIPAPWWPTPSPAAAPAPAPAAAPEAASVAMEVGAADTAAAAPVQTGDERDNAHRTPEQRAAGRLYGHMMELARTADTQWKSDFVVVFALDVTETKYQPPRKTVAASHAPRALKIL